MMTTGKFAVLLAALLVAASGAALASGPPDIRMEPAPINRLDLASQQRGARIFVNYCLNCHTAKYMRYNRLTDLGLTEAQIRDHLMFATDRIGDTMTIAMRPADAKAVAAARLVFVNGLGFEGWMPRLAKAAGGDPHLVEASRGSGASRVPFRC